MYSCVVYFIAMDNDLRDMLRIRFSEWKHRLAALDISLRQFCKIMDISYNNLLQVRKMNRNATIDFICKIDEGITQLESEKVKKVSF